MPEIPVGQPSGGGIGGIPTKYLVIGGGAVVLAFFFLSKKGSTATAADPNAPSYGNALGPNAALALGSLQTQVLQESGTIQQQMQGYFGALGDTISGLSTHLDTQAAAISDQQTAQGTSWFSQLMSNMNAGQLSSDIHSNEIRTELGTIINPSQAEWYRQSFDTWLAKQPGYGATAASA